MSNEMDELLEKLKAEYQQKKTKASQTPPPRKPPQKPKKRNSQPKKTQSSESMEEMLGELRNELEAGRDRPNNTPTTPAQSKPPNNKIVNRDLGKTEALRDRLIAEIEREYRKQEAHREQKRAAQKKREQELLAAQQRRERELLAQQEKARIREQRRKEALKQQAAEWLKKLNPNSEEGRWFEEFSYSYESKLDAAIDYLEAMRESGL
ncbi:MAG: hypothetical protein Tsb0014_42520 [Pleurocapsa sp.]